jgi:small subunit ribosomal protein S9
MEENERHDEETQAEEPTPEEPVAEKPTPEEPVAEEPTPEEPAAEEPPTEEPPAEEPEAPAPTQQAEPAPAAPGRPDLPPGAELEPITLEPERVLDAEERARLEAEAEERARLEAEVTAEREAEPEITPQPRVSLEAGRQIQATGKRKSSVARVIVRAGAGEFTVNGRGLDAFFPRPHLQSVARQPLVVSGYTETVDVRVRVHGGGVSGQADAIRHGIARALAGLDPELRGELKRRGLLSRDARIKERRKAGLKKARKRPQFSKR